MGSISFEIFLCENVCCLIKNYAQRHMGIRETGLFSVLSKNSGSFGKSVFKDKTLSSSFFFFFVAGSLFLSAHLVHALQLSLCTAHNVMCVWQKINIINTKGHKKTFLVQPNI